jgi:protein-disulfide isomerase
MRAHGTVAVVVALAGAVACADAPAAGAGGADVASREPIAAANAVAVEPEPQALDIANLGMDRGADDAPVRVIEFSDYGCGYCRKFHQETWPVLLRDFVDAGKVEWKFLPYVTGMFGNSTAATTAAECVLEQGDSLFHTMNSLIWGQQSEWKRGADPGLILRGLAHESGADLMRYDSCLAQGRRTQRVEGANALALQIGVRATPTFFVVGYPPIQGALPTDVFVRVLTMVYEEVTKAGGTP